MRRILGLVVKWAAIVFVLLFLVALFGQPFILEVPFRLAFGWIGFLEDNLAAMEVNPLLVAEAAVCVAVLGAGGHWFARWLYREMVPDAPGSWRPGWTVAGLAGVLLLFVAGIATIGITHQAAWLFTAKGPLLHDFGSDRARVSEAMLLATEARTAVSESYAKTGKLPASAEEAAWSPPAALGRHVKSIAVGREGVVTVEVVKAVAGGGTITLTPAPDGAALKWTCRGTLPPRALSAGCRE